MASCTRDKFCYSGVDGASGGTSGVINWEIDWTSRYSLNNWINILDMHCASSLDIGIFGSLFFAGYLVSCAIFPPMADKYGRKIFVIGVCVL